MKMNFLRRRDREAERLVRTARLFMTSNAIRVAAESAGIGDALNEWIRASAAFAGGRASGKKNLPRARRSHSGLISGVLTPGRSAR